MVSHDAGGAEILSSLVRRLGLSPLYVIDGPAKKIFKRKLGKVITIDLQNAMMQADILLCSTSWQSDLEFNAIDISKSLKIPSIAFLDHWVNYREIFSRNSRYLFPDQIWVGDNMSKKIASTTFPKCNVFFEENPYFLDIKEELANIKYVRSNKRGQSILYVCEPIREHAKLRYGNELHWGYTQEDAIRYFLDNLSALNIGVREIRIRPHPSETAEKYSWVKKEFNLPFVESDKVDLLTEINACDIVVGCESMAMVVGLLAGKKVFSCIPPYGKDCSLPHRRILKIKDLLSSL